MPSSRYAGSDWVSQTTKLPSEFRPKCQLFQPGLVDYDTAWQWQRSQLEQRRQQPDLEDLLLLLEHPPLYTLGQAATLANLKLPIASLPYPIHRTERGGEVTHHCPGQVVGYPILNLRRHQPDLHWYLRQLEEVLIQVLDLNGLKGDRLEGYTGVWVEGRKVAAIGVKVSRWITMHGFALNVCPDLSGFEAIVPCGIADKPVGSLCQFLPNLQPATVQEQVSRVFAALFQLEMIPCDRWAAPSP